nr:hypothetical protein [Tanacetum cinerariifolium]
MSQKEILLSAHEEAWVPKVNRVKISTINIRIDPTMTQKEETYQVSLEIIKKPPSTSPSLPLLMYQKSTCNNSGSQSLRSRTQITMSLSWQTRSVNLMLRRGTAHPSHRTRIQGRKTTSDDRFRQSKVSIAWAMFYKKYVDFAELILEDFSYQIDNRQLKKGRREIMPYPRFTKIIINHFLSIHKYVPKALLSGLHTIKDDAIRDLSDVYQILYWPDTAKEKKRRRISKKKVLISTNDNIIPEPNVALELGKSTSLTKVAEEEAARQFHATHERIVIESDPKPARRRPSEQLAADMMQALKASKKSSRSQPHAEGLSKETGMSLGVPDESIVVLITSSGRAGTKPGVPDEVQCNLQLKLMSYLIGDMKKIVNILRKNADEEVEWLYSDEEEEKKDNASDDRSIDLEKTNDEETDEEFLHSDEEITVTSKADVGKTEEVKDDNKKAKLPPSSFSLSIPHIQSPSIVTAPVSVILEPIVISPIPEIPIETFAITIPPPLSVTSIILVIQQQSTPIPTPPITTVALVVTTILDPLLVIIQRVYVIEKDIQELKEVDHTTTLLASLRSEIQLAQVDYKDVIEESVQANFINEKALEKTLIVLAQSSSQAQSSLKAAESLSEYELKMILYEKMDKSCSYLTHDKHQALFYALLNSMCLDDFVAHGQANPNQEEPVEEPAFEMASDDIKQTVDDIVNDDE